MPGSPFADRVNSVDWSLFQTAYGRADAEHAFGPKDMPVPSPEAERWGSIAEQLVRLASTDPDEALAASHHLWCCLCHQHAYVSSAALPALPFLLEVLDRASTALALEILDIVEGIAVCAGVAACAASRHPEAHDEWMIALRRCLVGERARLETWCMHPDERIRDAAAEIQSAIGALT